MSCTLLNYFFNKLFSHLGKALHKKIAAYTITLTDKKMSFIYHPTHTHSVYDKLDTLVSVVFLNFLRETSKCYM